MGWVTRGLLGARALALLGGVASTGCLLPSYEEGWNRKFGGIKVDESRAVVIDSCKSVILVGRYESYMSFDGEETFVEPDTLGNIFVAKYDSEGDPLWSRQLGDAAIQGATSIAVDDEDNIFVAGEFMGALQIGDTTLTNPNPPPADMMTPPVTHVFVAKLGEDGAPLWGTSFGDPTNLFPTTSADIAVDTQGRVIVMGNFAGIVDFGGGARDSGMVADTYLVKYEAGGGHVFSQSFDDTALVNGRGVATDADDNILVTGEHQGVLTIGGEALPDAGSTNAFVAKIDGSGAPVLWARTYGVGFTQIGHGIAVDADRNVLVTGMTAGMVDFGGGVLDSVPKDGGPTRDIFVLKLSPAGVHQWSRDFGGTGVEEGLAIAVDSAGDVIVTGTSDGDLGFDGAPLVAAGEADIVLTKVSGADGQARSSSRFGDAKKQSVTGLAVSPEGDIFLTGNFVGKLEFGGTPLENNNIDLDFFLARLMPLP